METKNQQAPLDPLGELIEASMHINASRLSLGKLVAQGSKRPKSDRAGYADSLRCAARYLRHVSMVLEDLE